MANDECEKAADKESVPAILPLNPYAQTGKSGKGKLWHWGPNYAADAVVIRETGRGETLKMEVLLIQRRSGRWATPGGFRDPNEAGMAAALRELKEETSIEIPSDHISAKGELLFEGYVADDRNTDHAWIETTAVLFRVGEEAAHWVPKGLDDAADARWFSVEDPILDNLHANHSVFVRRGIERVRARSFTTPTK